MPVALPTPCASHEPAPLARWLDQIAAAHAIRALVGGVEWIGDAPAPNSWFSCGQGRRWLGALASRNLQRGLGGDVLVPPFSTGSHIGITCATGLSVTVATGAGDGEGPHADLGGKPSSQVAARTLETGRCAWSCPAVVPCGDRRTTSTTRLPVAPPLRGMLRSSRCSVGPDWPPPRSANTWSISDMGLQEAFEGLIGFAAGDLLVWRSCDRLAVPFLNLGCDLRSRKQSDQVDKA